MKAIIVCCYDNYEVRVKYVEKYLLNKGYDVRVLTSNFNHITKERKKAFDEHCELIPVPSYRKNISYQRIYSEAVFSKRVCSILRRTASDFIYLIAPPNLLIKSVSKFKTRSNVFLVDLLDVWPESFPNRLIANNKLWMGLRNKYINIADVVFLECDYFKKFVDKYLPEEKMKIVYLTKELVDTDIEFDGNIVQILYLGSINSIFDEKQVIRLLSHINRKKEVYLHIIGGGEKRDIFINLLEENGIRYKYYGLIFDEDEKEKIITKCNYGLNLYIDGVKIGLTMKSIDYFRYGLPVISRNIIDTEKMIDIYKAGYVLSDNIDEISNQIVKQTEKSWKAMHENVLKIMRNNFVPEVLYQKLDEAIISKE